jgi:hypothetical protein
MYSGLGGDALSPPAMGGREAPGLDCFSFFLVRVLCAKWKASSSNSRFFRAVDAKGLFCKMYLPRVLI